MSVEFLWDAAVSYFANGGYSAGPQVVGWSATHIGATSSPRGLAGPIAVLVVQLTEKKILRTNTVQKFSHKQKNKAI
eukprot:5962535-Amphidinium_carterae.1